ncbi:DUF1501 domain-containing protein [Paracoccus aerodenitrificans]|uniref:DUF1501 domain-containing protein n=1 Tax=Paracoccus aerodenitrificans TaxID=3017781 RepID=UPI0022F0E47E|nr:DUF1501 domain-containing protein [Paracoccus aerodenitrificans]WBU63241.1 DUF1501 domain-containing protein [Paracoccus aerodenitrificans]
MHLSRRDFLTASMAAACSAAALPGFTRMSFASAPGDKRFVAIILRGAMDGLDAVQPYGDPFLRKLRRNLSLGPEAGALDLDGFFALHPALAPLMPMWTAGELAFAHAVSTPYRDKRSHFDGQDILEAGTETSPGPSSPDGGWLNRLLPLLPESRLDTAYAVGTDELSIMRGDAAYSSWAPEARLNMSAQAQDLLQSLYESDPPFQSAAETAIQISLADKGNQTAEGGKQSAAEALASFTASRLNNDTRIAAFSLTGWDTHHRQDRIITRPLDQLATALNVLKRDLGKNWQNTVVMAMTEFGRTVRENGTGGTDHGTGGLSVLAGGAVRGKVMHDAWPGLDDSDLYAGRDLMPVADVRSYAGAVLAGLFGLPPSAVEGRIFPGVDMTQARKVLL